MRAALVTGAAAGIGRAVTERLLADGWDVLAADLRPDPDGPGTPYAADLTTRDGNRGAVEATLQAFGRIDAVVANAGFQHVAPIEDFDEDRWDALLSILLTSPFLLAKHAWPALRRAPEGGRFLVIASAHALVASPFKAGYVSAKHGAVGLVKTLALEGAEHGISATALCPGYVRTALVEKQICRPGAGARDERGAGARRGAAGPAGRQADARARGGRRRRGVPARPVRPRLHRRRGADGQRLDSPLSPDLGPGTSTRSPTWR